MLYVIKCTQHAIWWNVFDFIKELKSKDNIYRKCAIITCSVIPMSKRQTFGLNAVIVWDPEFTSAPAVAAPVPLPISNLETLLMCSSASYYLLLWRVDTLLMLSLNDLGDIQGLIVKTSLLFQKYTISIFLTFYVNILIHCKINSSKSLI